MSTEFRELLRKVGSGTHTSKPLSRTESQRATTMMWTGEATPAQIGAFMIAHRIKRPTPPEIAGMLDAYDALAQKIPALDHALVAPWLLGNPYDGRSKTSPISLVVGLVLVAAGQKVILHGAERMATKEGLPLVEVWDALAVPWRQMQPQDLQEVLAKYHLAFAYQPNILPQSVLLAQYRAEIGKRPPFATLELIWSPYAGPVRLVTGFVHPPTENNIREALILRGETNFITSKGLEGSIDLPQSRTAIIGLQKPGAEFARLTLSCRDYGISAEDLPILPALDLAHQIEALIYATVTNRDQVELLRQGVLWNSGFMLWQAGITDCLASGISHAQTLLDNGAVGDSLTKLRTALR